MNLPPVQPNWLTNKKILSAFFILPALLGLLATWKGDVVGYNPQPTDFASTMFFLWFTDSGHVIATFLLMRSGAPVTSGLEKKILLTVATVTALSGLLFAVSHFAFQVVIGYVALAHIILQHYGWLRRIQRHDESPNEKIQSWEKLAFFCIILGPIYYWHTGSSAVSLGFFFPDNLILRTSLAGWPFLMALSFASFAFLSFSGLSETLKFGRPTRLIFFSTTALWWFGGLVLAPTDAYFWTYLVCCHGWSYIFHSRSVASGGLGLLPHLAIIFGAGGIWYVTRDNLSSAFSVWTWLVWLPLIYHYTFDSIVWKSRPSAILGPWAPRKLPQFP